jgi:hypothetical protein
VTKLKLIAEKGALQCWQLTEPFFCFYLDLYEVRLCRSPADFIIQHRDDDSFAIPLCKQHLPQWAKQALTEVNEVVPHDSVSR